MTLNTFLDGNVLVPIEILQNWIVALNRIIPGTTGDLNVQLVDSRLDIESIINATPSANITVGKVVLPIVMVNELKYAIAIYEYQYNPFNAQTYFDMVDSCHSIFDQYSISFYNSNYGSKLVIY